MARWVSGRGLLALQALHNSPCVIQGPPPALIPLAAAVIPITLSANVPVGTRMFPLEPDRGYKYQVGSCSLKHQVGCAKSPQMVRLRDPCARETTAAFGKGTECLTWVFEGSTPLARSLFPASFFAALVSPGICIPCCSGV